MMRMRTYFPVSESDGRLRSLSDHRLGFDEPDMFVEEMLAWSRWQLGWLDPTQIRCLTEPIHSDSQTYRKSGKGYSHDRHTPFQEQNPRNRK